nr:hypothetical protein [uncultured Draconibacterium sp.]
MKLDEIYKRANSVDGIGGMTVNERLHASGLMELFDISMKNNKGFARVILEALKVDEPSIFKIVGLKKQSNSTTTPWDFDNENPRVFSPNGKDKIKYFNLLEIAMGAPLAGKAYLINSKNEKLLIHQRCGVPPIWNTAGNKIAIPIWTQKLFKGTIQKIGIVDIEENEFILYKRTFNVLAFNGFNGNEIYGIDSPMHKPKTFIFNISNEKIESKIKNYW